MSGASDLSNGTNRFLVNLALLVLSLLSSLALVELGLRTMAPQNVSGSWRTNSPTGLFVNKSHGSAQHQLDGRIAHYVFHPPHLRDTALTDTGHTVLTLGDSYTFGWLLGKEDTFIHKMQILADMEFGGCTFNFLNAAAGGWGTADYVAYVEEFGKIVDPDIIIVFLNTDDVGRSLKSPLYSFRDRDSLVLERNRVEPGTLKELSELIPFYDWLLENLHSLQLLRKAYLTLGSRRAPTGNGDVRTQIDVVPHSGALDALQTSEAVDLAKALFLRLKRWADENGSELYVTTTGWHRPPYDEGPPEPTRAFMALAERFFEQAGIPYNDVSSDVLRARKQAPESFIIPNDGHPNERGSELIATSVWPFIKEKLHEFCAEGLGEEGADTGMGKRTSRRAGCMQTLSTGRPQLPASRNNFLTRSNGPATSLDLSCPAVGRCHARSAPGDDRATCRCRRPARQRSQPPSSSPRWRQYLSWARALIDEYAQIQKPQQGPRPQPETA